jgi:hypothetical protein
MDSLLFYSAGGCAWMLNLILDARPARRNIVRKLQRIRKGQNLRQAISFTHEQI